MESPLLTKTENNVEVTINADSSSSDERIVDMTAHDDDSSSPHEAEGVGAWYLCIEKWIWNFIGFVVTLVQIFASILILTLTKDEQKTQVPLYPWIMVYTCASIATLPILCWRFWHNCTNETSETRINDVTGMVMGCLETMLEYFFMCWVLIFLWGVLVEPSCLDDTTQHFWLWVALLAFSCVRYVLPHLPCAAECFSCPVTICIDKFRDFIEMIIGLIRSLGYCIYAIFVCICG